MALSVDDSLAFLERLDQKRLRSVSKDEALTHLKTLYDYVHSLAPSRSGPVHSLVTRNVDSEQIWTQLEFQNEAVRKMLRKGVSRALESEADIELIDDYEHDEDEDDEDEIERMDEDDDDQMSESNVSDDQEDEDDEQSSNAALDNVDSGQYDEDDDDENDGGWFGENANDDADENNDDENEMEDGDGEANFDDVPLDFEGMERFLQDAEERARKDAAGEENEVQDLIDDMKDAQDEEAAKIRFKDFFGEEERKRGDDEDDWRSLKEPLFPEGDVDDDALERAGVDEQLVSAFEARQKKLEDEIREIEKQQLEDKHWALRGEVTKQVRPENSLLEAFVDFDMASVGVPHLTEEHTARIEELIKRRVKEGTFDDVARKTEADVAKFKPKIKLDFAKSDKGLGEVFEEAYLKAIGDSKQEEEKLTPEKRKIQKLFRELCRQLDALTNEHYRPSAPKVKDIDGKAKEVKAVQLEEVAPVGVSGAKLLAPEEIAGRKKLEKSEKELEHDDRQKRRRKRKEIAKKKKRVREERQRNRAAQDEEYAARLRSDKEAAAVGKAKNVKIATEGAKSGKDFTRSTKFFAQLQEQVDNEAKGIKPTAAKKAKTGGGSGASFKL